MRTQPRRHLAVLVAAALVAAMPVLAASPASGDTIHAWKFDTRPPDAPVPPAPALTLGSGAVDVVQSFDGTVLRARVELVEAPDDTTASDLRLVFGTGPADGECTPLWETVVPTLDPGDLGSRDGAIITFERELEAGQGDTWTCGYLSLTAPGDPTVVHDLLVARDDGIVIADRAALVKIVDVRRTRLVPDRWSRVRVELKNKLSPVTSVKLTGSGKGLRVRPRVLRDGMEDEESVTVSLRVKLLVSRSGVASRW